MQAIAPTTFSSKGICPSLSFSTSRLLRQYYPAGTSTAISVNVALTAWPDNADLVAASGYVTLSAPTITFTQPNQTKTILVTVKFPTGTPIGDTAYSYQITTSGWPGGQAVAGSGTSINANVTPLPPARYPDHLDHFSG